MFKLPHKINNFKTPTLVLNKDSISEKVYLISPGDRLNLRNIQNETAVLGYLENQTRTTGQDLDYIVESDTCVTLPYLGKVSLAGMSIIETEKYLNKEYSKKLLKEPLIKVNLTNLKVTFLGEFSRQGNISLNNEKTHLIEAIGANGGLNQRANSRKIKIIRGNLSNPTVILINLEDIRSLSDNHMYLQNNDIIYAESRNGIRVIDNLTSTRTLIGIGMSLLSAYIIVDRLNR
ncbi:polysaccharide biosynthesis/export family protein [Pedobacter glucosidilyticus]|uniref:polysaccharide biosynthesis/export family protein n=1 Tax=Pedobacter glucosidilyticus TaxID=1122941 RepID=UPI001B7FA543